MKTLLRLNPVFFFVFSLLLNFPAGAYDTGFSGRDMSSLHATDENAELACYAPNWLNTYNITQTSATLEWAAAYGAQSYNLQWRIAGQPWAIFGGGPWTNTWLYIGGLQPGTTYEWRIQSNCSGGQYSDWSYTESFTTLYGSSCSTPTWPTTSYITQTSAELSWDPVSGAWDYDVQYRLPGGTWYSVPGSPTSSTWINLGGLNPGTTYEWRVRAICSYGQYSYWTNPVTFTTLGGYYCNPPTWLSSNNITQTSANLDWDPVSGATGYSIQYRLPGGSWYNVPGGPFTQSWYTLTGLTPGTTYEWRVKSHCGYNNYSAWSYVAYFTTLAGYSCDTPTWPTTSNITSTSATFSWDAVYGAQSYIVQMRLPNGTWYDIPANPVYNTSVTVTGLNPNTTYEWRVKAKCGYNNFSNWTWPKTFTTLGSSCYPPNWLGTNNITQTSATLDWSPVSGAMSYTVQYRTPGGYWYDVPGGPFTGTWATLNGLSPCTTYEWRVKSNCGYGQYSYWSSVSTFTTLCYTCDTPTWPTTSNITSTSATFSWDAVYGALSYIVQMRLPNGTWYDIPGNPVYNTSVTVTGLSPNTTYEWRVKAKCGYNNFSDWTWPKTFTTLGSSCYPPYWLGTTNITQTSATLDWSSVSGAMSYTVQYRTPGGYWYDVPGGPFTGTWATLNGLAPCTTYEWRVKSNCGYGQYSYWSSVSTFTTLCYSCSTPLWPSTSNVTQTTATFTWMAVSGAMSYTVQTRLPNGTWYDIPGGPVYGTSVTVTGLYPNTTYQWRVKANCGYGNYSDWTWPINFTTLGEPNCYAPTWLGTNNITSTSATLDWNAVSGAWSYSLEYRVWGGNWMNVPGGPYTETWFTLYNLQPGTTYEWRVRTNCGSGYYSPWSYPDTFTTLGSYCTTPTWPSTYNITQTSATFSWSPVSGAQNYTVQYRLPNGTWYEVPGSPVNNTSITLTGLTPGTTYEWRVKANCGYGSYSDWTWPKTFTTLGSSCTTPTWPNTYNITQASATFSWSPVSGAQSYTVQYRLPNGTWYEVPGSPTYNTSITLTGLSPGTTYEWRVKANCGYGSYSDWTWPISFTTLGTSCGTPTWPTTSNVTATTATLSWDPVYGAQSYTVQLRVLPSGTWYNVPGGPFYNTSVTVTGLTPGTSYEWRVKANCGYNQYSDWTWPVTFTTSSYSGGNDDCVNAIQLSVHPYCSNTPGTNVNATPSVPAPVGGCSPSSYKDVWFKFTMPGGWDPTVTIRTTAGTLADGVMEVYHGPNCSNLYFISCEDDNINGNGSMMPVINITGYPNETIWIRFWGYWGMTGTFSICVFDGYSSNLVVPVDETAEIETGDLSDVIEEVETADVAVDLSLHAVPNPVSDELQVSLTQTEDTRVTRMALVDISGKVMLVKEYEWNDQPQFRDQLDVSALEPGLYVLQVRTTSGILTEKVMVVDK